MSRSDDLGGQARLDPPALPAELVDCIIDYLHDHKQTLVSCALVARQWLCASQLHLFRSLHCHKRPYDRDFEPFRRFLQASDHLTPFVEELVLDASPKKTIYQRIPRLEKTELSRSTLIAIIGLLPSLRSLELRRVQLTDYHVTTREDVIWSSQRTPLSTLKLTAVGNFLATHGLVLANDGSVFRVLSIIPSISELHLSDMSFPYYPQPVLPLQRRARNTIKALYINNCRQTGSFFRCLKEVCCTNELELFSTTSEYMELESISTFIQDKQRHLIHLDLRLQSALPGRLMCHLRDSTFSLEKCGALESVTLQVHMASTMLGNQDSWSILSSFLPNLPPSIRRITVNVIPGTRDFSEKFPVTLESQNWGPISEGLERLVGLDSITFVLVHESSGDSEASLGPIRGLHRRVKAVIEAKLLPLSAQEVLCISSDVLLTEDRL